MCGIFCSISRNKVTKPSQAVNEAIKARGPDACRAVIFESDQTRILLQSTVLSLRGESITTQPYQRGSTADALCWNGEAWSIAGVPCSGDDTSKVYALLENVLVEQNVTGVKTEIALAKFAKATSQIAGPYAFVFYDQVGQRLFFGRDFLGRRSLLYSLTNFGDLLLASVAGSGDAEVWREVEADGIYCIDLKAQSDDRSWGSWVVHKSEYHFSSNSTVDQTSVLPRLVLNRDTHIQSQLEANARPVRALLDLLSASVNLRSKNIPEPPAIEQYNETSHKKARIACLFSGGLDCTVLARLLHEFLPPDEPVDLLNVAFENPRIHKTADDAAYESCPDRMTGRSSYDELCQVCPGRTWRFVVINVPFAETQLHRDKVISLISPHNTEMDLSIALALYFASRGAGRMISPEISEPSEYTTSARVLFSGLGADELFAGYTRHATAFSRRGMEGLLDELELDVARLGKRNLGRDDRVISHWGKEARYPYLDEDLVRWALQAPVFDKTGFAENADAGGDNGTGLEPGKKVLRCIAWRTGMKRVAREKKRAVYPSVNRESYDLSH